MKRTKHVPVPETNLLRNEEKQTHAFTRDTPSEKRPLSHSGLHRASEVSLKVADSWFTLKVCDLWYERVNHIAVARLKQCLHPLQPPHIKLQRIFVNNPDPIHPLPLRQVTL